MDRENNSLQGIPQPVEVLTEIFMHLDADGKGECWHPRIVKNQGDG